MTGLGSSLAFSCCAFVLLLLSLEPFTMADGLLMATEGCPVFGLVVVVRLHSTIDILVFVAAVIMCFLLYKCLLLGFGLKKRHCRGFYLFIKQFKLNISLNQVLSENHSNFVSCLYNHPFSYYNISYQTIIRIKYIHKCICIFILFFF